MSAKRGKDDEATAGAVPDFVSIDAPPRRVAGPAAPLSLPDPVELRKSTACDSAAAPLVLPDPKAPDNKTPATKAPVTKTVATKASDTKTVATKASDTKTAATKASDTKTPDTKTPDRKQPGGATPDGTSPRSHPSVRLIMAAVVVAVLAVGVVTYATTQPHHSKQSAASPQSSAAPNSVRPTSTPTFPLSAGQLNQRAALAWMATNLPRNAALLTDPTVSSRLISLGFTSVLTTPGATLPQYVVSDRALRANNGAYGAVLARSVPVARFGSANGVVEVRSVLTVIASRVAAVLAADRTNRRLAGMALVRNPQLVLTPVTRTVLRAGDLDLRAATYLALIASDTRVQVTALPIDPAEAAASRPRRIITLAVTGKAAASVRATAAASPPAYAPTTVVATTPGSLTLTWNTNAQPVEPVS